MQKTDDILKNVNKNRFIGLMLMFIGTFCALYALLEAVWEG